MKKLQITLTIDPGILGFLGVEENFKSGSTSASKYRLQMAD